MDIEQLKIIIETLNAAGEGASNLIILWLAKDFVMTPLVICLLGWFLPRLCRQIGLMFDGDARAHEDALLRLRARLIPSLRGVLVHSEVEAIEKKVSELLRDKDEQ